MPCKPQYQSIMQKPLHGSNIKIPKLMFTVLNGGKAAGSKVRFSKFYLIMDVGVTDKIDALEVYYKISTQIKKAISSHKLGEAGFKANQSGQYYNALDTINDSFKLLEDAIGLTGVNVSSFNIYLTLNLLD